MGILLWAIGLALLVALVLWIREARRRRSHPVPAGLQEDIELPHEQEFELYHNAFSLCSMKTRLCLAELGIPYESHHIDLVETGAYENIRPAFLAINPAGTVPVLVHQGHPIYESHEQIRYAASFAAPGRASLVPEDPGLRAEMEEWIDLSSLTEDPINNADKSAGNAVPGQTIPLFATMLEKISGRHLVEGLLFHFDKIRPFLFAMLKLRGVENLHKIPPVSKALATSRTHLHRFLERVETQLEKTGGPWMLGDHYSLADVSWLVIFERIRQVAAENVFLDPSTRPRTAAYWARLQERPAYAEAISSHSHPIVEFGRERIVEAKRSRDDTRVLLEGDRAE